MIRSYQAVCVNDLGSKTKNVSIKTFLTNESVELYIFLFCESVISNCCKYKLLEIPRLLSHADLHTVGLSRTFHLVTH